MEQMLGYLVRRLEPRVGWAAALLLLSAAICPALAARGAALRLPEGALFWAGAAGATIGLRLAGRARPGRWLALYAPVVVALCALLLAGAAALLPPVGLALQDARAWAATVAAWLRGAAAPPPRLLGVEFLGLGLARHLGALATAPGGGEAGAALIVGTLAVPATLGGALILGWACGTGRWVLGWGLPLVAALGLVTILGGADGVGLVLGLGALFALAVLAGHGARERAWDVAGADYSGELRWGALGWGSLLAAAALLLALVLPTALPRLPGALPGAGELPSGLAAIGRNVERGGGPRPVDPGLSQLPAVALGVSLAQGAPETAALRVRVAAPLAPGPWPRYWRARVLNIYTGRGWFANARRGSLGATLGGALPTGVITQEVELQGVAAALPALADVVGFDAPGADAGVVAERLPEGALAAITAAPELTRYVVASRPQELAPPAAVAVPGPPPYGAESLALPGGLPPRVAELARSVAGGRDAEAAALALESYLRALPYTYEVRPIPAGGDAVDQFLFEMRHGYCTYYASAMAVMARSLGIPARIAVGYATGAYDPATRSYLVREADAHAWPELYIGGRWLPFEPTPARPLPERLAPGAAADAPPPAPVAEAPPPARAGPPWPWLAGAALLLIVAGAGAALLLARRTPLSARAQLRLERVGARAGVAWPPGATLHEYARLLGSAGVGPPADLGAIIALLEAERYGGRALSRDERARLAASAAPWRAPAPRRTTG